MLNPAFPSGLGINTAVISLYPTEILRLHWIKLKTVCGQNWTHIVVISGSDGFLFEFSTKVNVLTRNFAEKPCSKALKSVISIPL